jgi:hypothetical protein
MNEFLRAAYGDPCRECGFEWSVEPATCVAIVSDAAVALGAAGQLAESTTVRLAHPEQGPLSLDDVRRIMAHEIEHHVVDLILIVSA